MGLIPGLSNSLSGMKVAQSQLEIIGRNISNVDTIGYTRKYAQQNTLILAGQSAGVKLGEVRRNVNEGLLKSFLSSNSLSGNLNGQYQYLSKTEILLGTPEGNNSVASNVSNLQKSFDTFATDVTSAAGRYELLNNAQTLTSRMNYLTQEIQKLRGDADLNINGAVEEINTLLNSIDNLNDSIVKYGVLGYDGKADLLDQRDQALRQLSGMIDVTYFTRETGEIVIQTTNGVTLLDRDPHKLSHNAVAQASPTTSYPSSGITGIFVDGKDITGKIKDGEIKGLIEVRDVTLPSLQAQLDELSAVLKNSINAMHNQGTAYPATPSSMSGTRNFISPANQQIKIEKGDVRFTIFDDSGKQVKTVSLGGDLGFTQGSMEDLTTTLQDWMRSPTGGNLPQAVVQIDDNGNFKIDTGDSDYSISVMDQETSTTGSPQQDAVIKFDSNGNGNFDRSFEGFSNFLGLNDFFVSNTNEAIYDSKVLDRGVNLGVNNIVTLGFSDTTNGINFGEINVYPNDSLQDIVNKINSDPSLNKTLNASLVPNGSGVMLRIVNTSGEQLEINENRMAGDPSSGLIERLGLGPSNAGMAGSISVRPDLVTSPSKIAGGSPEFNKSSGEYQLNPSANNIANAMSKVFSNSQTFAQSGTISKTATTLANYAATFVGNIASATNNAESTLVYQQELTNSISQKESRISGVDIDEELAQMIMFQQTYAACAQAFTASKEILDLLLDIV